MIQENETLREIEERRHELQQQRQAWRSVEKYINGIVDAIDVHINQTFDEWETAFYIVYPDMTPKRVDELVLEAVKSKGEDSAPVADIKAYIENK